MRRREGWGALGWPRRDGARCKRARARVRRVEVPGTSGQQERAQGARGAAQCPAPVTAAMTENSDKVPIALVGPDEVEFCSPPVSTAWEPQTRGARIPCPGSAICVTELSWEQMWAPKCGLGVAPHGCACARGLASPVWFEGEGG